MPNRLSSGAVEAGAFFNLNGDELVAIAPVKASGAEVTTGTNDTKFITPKALADAGETLTPVKATGAEVTTGTNDTKFATPKALADAGIVATPVKASGAEVDTGTNDAKFVTPKALADAGILPGSAGVAFDRSTKIAIKPLTGAGLHAGVLNWQNPEAVSIIITKAIVDVTTVATGAAKVDVGTTAASNVTASDNLIDGIDVNAATGLLGQADGDGTTNSKLQQKLAAGKWVTFKEISGDVTGLVANAYIFYNLV